MSRKANTLRNSLKDDAPEIIVEVEKEAEKVAAPAPKKRAQKKTEEKTPEIKTPSTPFLQRFSGIGNILKDKTAQLIFGSLLILISSYLLVAFTSFIFTWKVDQDKLSEGWSLLLSDPEMKVENWMGKFGAIISHIFIHNGFGIASFLIVPIIFSIGFKIVFKTNLLPINKTIRYSTFGLLWLSACMGFAFSNSFHFLGGSVGYIVNNYLNSVLGSVGTGLLLFVSLAGFSAIVFNLLAPRTKKEEVQEEMEEESLQSIAETKNKFKFEDIDIAPVKSEFVPEEPFMKEEEDQEEEELSSGPELELEMPEPVLVKKEEPKNEPELELEVENMPKEEPFRTFNEVQSKIEEERLANMPETSEDLLAKYGAYDPTLDLSEYRYPTIDLLNEYGGGQSIDVSKEELENNKNRIVKTLMDFGIEIEKIKATIGPTVVLYEIVPKAGVKISKIKNLEDDIALSLSALGIRIIAPMPGKGTIGIEVPNSKPQVVPMSTILSSEKFVSSDMDLPIALGKTISNEVFVTDLTKMPHLLMAGATGQGKSVGLNAILTSLLYKKHPSQLKLVLVDPKKVELTLFNKIERHFLAKLPDTEEAIITDNKKVINTLNSLCIEMDSRYELLKNAQVRNIKEYNKKFVDRRLNPNEGHTFLPYIVVVVDEFADLIITAGKEVETPIARLAQLARAVGIHLIIATQRPSVNVITGTIKANFPGRIAFRVASKIDSRTILDAGGAEQLIGRGDMLLTTGNDLIRIQCAFVDTPEVENICEFIGSQRAYPTAFMLPEYVGEDGEAGKKEDFDPNEKDSMFDEAAKLIVQHQQGSTSLIQRRLKLGYNRAGRIIDQLEAAGIVGPFEGSKARQVLIKDEMSLEQKLKDLK